MKKTIIITLIVFFIGFGSAYANCQGCCSYHGGVVCVDGVTMCADGTPLSPRCQAKGCNKCYGVDEKEDKKKVEVKEKKKAETAVTK